MSPPDPKRSLGPRHGFGHYCREGDLCPGSTQRRFERRPFVGRPSFQSTQVSRNGSNITQSEFREGGVMRAWCLPALAPGPRSAQPEGINSARPISTINTDDADLGGYGKDGCVTFRTRFQLATGAAGDGLPAALVGPTAIPEPAKGKMSVKLPTPVPGS